jgi:ethanolamine kinase
VLTRLVAGECTSHSLLASHKLAPPLLARFNNGLLYRFIPGKVCSPSDLRRPEIWRGIAQRIAEWHATLPISVVLKRRNSLIHQADGTVVTSKIDHLPSPNIWTVTQGWTDALPEKTDEERSKKLRLQKELNWLIDELGDGPGFDNQALVYGHCDLLSANVIVRPQSTQDQSPYSSSASSPTTAASTAASELPPAYVNFIDYEYATPCPAAFDISNHFAEWGGFDCDMSVLPTRSQRRDFLTTYIHSYNSYRGREFKEEELEQLMAEVDRFRGAPGFYWGVWALIQATISQIDFNYAEYADLRLSEYWVWKDSLGKEGKSSTGAELPLRERRWAEEE